MLYVDTDWLTNLRYKLGLLEAANWQDTPVATLSDPKWYSGYCQMVECLLDPSQVLDVKQIAVVKYLSTLMVELSGQVSPLSEIPTPMLTLADYLKKNASEEVSLETMCELSGYSSGHLIRSFKHHFGLTPHAYLVNHRIQCGWMKYNGLQHIFEDKHVPIRIRLKLFGAVITPTILYSLETCPLTENLQELLNIVQRTMLRRLVGWVCTNDDTWEERGRRMKNRMSSCLSRYHINEWSEAFMTVKSNV